MVSDYANTLLLRVAAVCLKEKRTLILASREAPFGTIPLRNRNKAANPDGTNIPPMLTFYKNPHRLGGQIMGKTR
jgi:4-hydroxy-3-polyprenylbenzoate decarboxylase